MYFQSETKNDKVKLLVALCNQSGRELNTNWSEGIRIKVILMAPSLWTGFYLILIRPEAMYYLLLV